MPTTPTSSLPARRARGGFLVLSRCAVSAAAALALEYVLLTQLVSRAHLHYLVSAAISGGAYLVVNFLLNRRWAFRAHGAPLWPQLFRHGVVVVGATLLALPLLWLSVHALRMPYQLGWLVAGGVAFLGWTFPMHRVFTYRAQLPAPAHAPAH